MQIRSEGGAPGGHNPPEHASSPRRALVGYGPHVGPSLISLAHVISYLQKKITISLSLSLSFLLSNPRISISLLESPFSKLFRGIVAWYVTPTVCPISFCFSGLYFE